MKNFIISAIVAAAAIAMSAGAQAASPQTATFNVGIGLTTGCVISAAPGAVNFTYVAFGGGASLDSNGSVGVSCTNNLIYTLSLDGGGSYTDDATNLAYTLSVPSGNITGTGAQQTHAITGSMAGGQAGNCATSVASCSNAASTNKTRTLTVAY